MALKRYITTVDGEGEEGKPLIWRQTAFTKRPAVKVKGLAYSMEAKEMCFFEGAKMRIAAPLIIPMVNYRKESVNEDGTKEPECETEFTVEEIEKFHAHLMSDPDKLKNFFNLEHQKEETVPAYLLEIWIVENPLKDKSFTTYGVKVPKGSLFAVAQITDENYFNKLVEEDVTGFSIEGFFGLIEASPKESKYSEGQEYADILIFNKENKLLVLLRPETEELGANEWGLAGGKIEEGETPAAAAIREAEEETGIKLEKVEEVKAITNEDGSISHYFKATTNEDAEISEEHTAKKWITAEEIDALEMIKGQGERFKQLFIEALQTKKEIEMADLKIEDGEHELDGKIYVFKDGLPVEVKEKAAEQEMSDEEKAAEEEAAKAEAEAKAKEEKMAEEEKTAGGEGEAETEVLTKETVTALVNELVKPMIDEAMKAVLETIVKEEEKDEEPVAAGAATELTYSEEEKMANRMELMNKLK